MTADLAAGFLRRALGPTGTIQIKQNRPDTYPDLFLSDAPDALDKAGSWVLGRKDVHYTLCRYEEFNYSPKTKFKREPEIHTPSGTWCVVIDADDKDNDGKLKDLTGQQIYDALRVKPDAIVRSGGGGFHAYWFSDFPMSAIDRSQARRFLWEVVSEAYVPDSRAGAYGHDHLRMPYSVHPSGNWCFIEVEAPTNTITKTMIRDLPPPRNLLEFFPDIQLFDYGVSYPTVSFTLPVEKFTNEELRGCAVYQSIQDEAHTHTGHVIDLFYLSWVNCIAEDSEKLLDKYVLGPLSECNTPDHYSRQWDSLKERSGNRCSNLDGNPARNKCVGCPVNGVEGGSPATLARGARELLAGTPVEEPAIPVVGGTPIVIPPLPPMNLTALPNGYTREDDVVCFYDDKSQRKVICSDFELVERTELDGERYVVVKAGGMIRVYKHAQTVHEFTRIIENSLGEFFVTPQQCFFLYQKWARLLPSKGSVVNRLGWQNNDNFATDKAVVTPDGELLTTGMPDVGARRVHQHYLDHHEDIAKSFWSYLLPIWSVDDCWAHRLTLLTIMGSVVQRFCQTPGNVWLSFKGSTGAGKTTLLQMVKAVTDAQVPGATTLAALENSFYQQGDCGSYMDEFVIKDEAGIQMLLSVLRGVTTNRSAKAGSVNQPLREWAGYSVLCSNEGLHNRLVQTDYQTMMATLARVIEVRMKRSVDPSVPTLIENFSDFQGANKQFNGCIGLTFSRWVAMHLTETQSLVKAFESHLSGGTPAKRFRNKWLITVLTAHEILKRMGWDVGGLEAADIFRDAEIMTTEHTASIDELKVTNPMLTVAAFLRSPSVHLVSIINALGPYSVPSGRRPVFQAAGFYYIPFEAVASVKARMGGSFRPDPNSYLKDHEILSMCSLWQCDRRPLILPGPFSDHRYDCFVVKAPTGLDARAPQELQEHYGELVGSAG